MFGHRHALAVIAVIGLVLLGFAVTIDYPEAAQALWSDEATYMAMAQSLAFDGDIVYQQRDLERFSREFAGGPSGVFIKRGRKPALALSSRVPFVASVGEFTDQLYYAKAYVYSLVAAPWVRLVGLNGMLVLHAILVVLVLTAGYFFIAATASPMSSLGYTLTFFIASVAPVYFIWLQPELFNLALVFAGLFFWLYKERAAAPPWPLRGATSDVAAALFFAAAFYSKPVLNAAIVPLLSLMVWRRQWRRALGVGVFFVGAVGALFLVNLWVTGDLNYQGGDRKTFYGRYPFQTPDLTFESAGLPKVTDEVYTQQPWDIVFYDLFYFHFGRFAGMVVYFFPAAAAVVWFLLARKEPWQWLLLVTASLECLLLIVWIPVNYHGGGGTLGNRYFMNIFPLYFFLAPAASISWRRLSPSWAVAGLFLTPILFNPFVASREPGEHATAGIWKWLPPELSLINSLPTNSDPQKFRREMDGHLAYFLDNNTWGREIHRGRGFWVKGRSEAELVVRTQLKADRLVVRVLNVSVPNRIRVCLPSGCDEQDYSPGEKKVLELAAGSPFPYEDFGIRSYCYRVRIAAASGEIPRLRRRGERDHRYLGAFIHIEPEPYPPPPTTELR